MQPQTRWVLVGLLASAMACSAGGWLLAEEPPTQKSEPTKTVSAVEPTIESPWLKAIPIPTDPELEEQIKEVQDALSTLYQQMVRRKEALQKTQDPTAKTILYDEFERLRKEREALEKLLHDLIDEAKLSEQTAIDAALARARWLEREQEYQQQKEEIIRDRQR